jgi:hypothetical protein
VTISAPTAIRFVCTSAAFCEWESYVRAKFKYRLVAIALMSCAVGVATWFGVQSWSRQSPRDFEQCSEKARSIAASEDKRISLIAQCDKEFAGRRKSGGGYTYFDFLQNRHFDIAGPNPTPNELKYFDEEYTVYLDTQRRDAVAAAMAERQNQDMQITLEDAGLTDLISSPEPSTVMAPTKVPLPRARSSAVRSRGSRCEEASISCSWTNVSAGIKNFFSSYATANRP